MTTVRDRLWLWGHVAGSHNSGWGLPATSRMTPTEAACYLGVPGVVMVNYQGEPKPPYDQHALALSSLDHVVWSIVGDAGRTSPQEIVRVRDLATKFPSIGAVIMDDFFHAPKPDGSLAPISPDDLTSAKSELANCGRKLPLWVVLYDHQLDLSVAPYLERCDVLTFWTWRAENLARLEANFERADRIAPEMPKVLGCYMWDYGNKKAMPLGTFRRQCEIGLSWLRSGRIGGMIFLASCICDLGLDAVEWARGWIREVGSEPVPG